MSTNTIDQVNKQSWAGDKFELPIEKYTKTDVGVFNLTGTDTEIALLNRRSGMSWEVMPHFMKSIGEQASSYEQLTKSEIEVLENRVMTSFGSGALDVIPIAITQFDVDHGTILIGSLLATVEINLGTPFLLIWYASGKSECILDIFNGIKEFCKFHGIKRIVMNTRRNTEPFERKFGFELKSSFMSLDLNDDNGGQ